MSKLKRFIFPTEEEDVPQNTKTANPKTPANEGKGIASKGGQPPTGVNPAATPTTFMPQQIGLFTPNSFEDAMPIVREMIKQKRVIVSIDKLWIDEAHKAVAQRLIDYLCGAAYAINFDVQKINEMAFLFEQTLPKV